MYNVVSGSVFERMSLFGGGMSTADDILNQALGLADPERATLAHQLILSLENDAFDDDSESAWAVEIEARLAAVEQGDFVASDWREAVMRIRRSLQE